MSIKIGVIPWSPGAMSCVFEPSCDQRGYGVDTTTLICEAMRINCTFLPYNNSDFGDYNETSGEVTGILGAITRREFDTSLPIFTPTHRRFRAVGFSSVYFYTTLVIATRAPSQYPEQDLNFLYTFQWPVWCALVFSLLLFCIFVTFVLVKDSISDKSKLSNFFKTAVSVIASDYGDCYTSSAVLRLLVLSWLATAFVLTASCTGFLLSSKLVKMTKLPYKDLESFIDCLYEGGCRLITTPSSASFLQLLTATEGLAARFAESLERYPAIKTSDSEIHERILQNQNAYLVWPGPSASFYYRAQNFPGCAFYTVEAPYKVFGAFPFKKDAGDIAKILNKMAGYFQQSGLADVVQKRYGIIDARPCNTGVQKREQFSSLKLSGLASLYKFYIISVAVAGITLGFEIISGRRNFCRRAKIRNTGAILE